ncbi:MAG: UDP-N-acetylmuramate dehydrogenase [Coriobacteriia bacterium]|nr:UDP-N-acetylmuramate dehydrogenase [Coriobacteriia bacterium]
MSVAAAHARLAAEMTGSVRAGESLAKHTSFRIGGPAALFVECDSVGDLALVMQVAEEEGVAWSVMGKGSNVLVSDAGYEGIVVVLGREFKRFTLDGEHLRCGAAVILAIIVQEAFKRGLTGLEFAVGIPGTVGGALAMNAGSREIWIGEIVESLTVYSSGSGLSCIRGEEVGWCYRSAGIPPASVVVEASLRLEAGEVDQIRRVMEASLRRRRRSQPLGVPSAGSVFVNPEGDSAGRLIEAAGLKGASVGGATVSDVHANFIVNTGTASAADVVELITRIRRAVRENNGIELEPEIRFLGSFEPA